MTKEEIRIAYVKIWGDVDLVPKVLKIISDNLNVIRESPILPTDDGGIHVYQTVYEEVKGEHDRSH